MEEKIINEIKRSLKLMGLNNGVFVESLTNNNNKLLVETSIKPHFNFPNVKSFDDFKADARYKSIPNLNKLDFKSTKSFEQTPSTLDGLLKHIIDYKPLWIGGLMQKNPSVSLATATKKINKAESVLTKIKNGTIKHGELEKLSSDGKAFGYETITNAGGLRDAIMFEYATKYPKEYKTFLATIKKGKPSAAAELKAGVSKVNSEKVDTKIKEKTNPTTKKKYKPEEYKTDWKNAGGDETKLSIALDRGWVKGNKVPDDLKVKGSKPTPSKTTTTATKSFTPGTIGYAVESTPKPDGSGNYVWKEVQTEWRAKGGKTGDKNKAISTAWNERKWRPGDEIPDDLKSSYANETKIESEKLANEIINDVDNNLFRQVSSEYGDRLASQKYDDLLKDYGIDKSEATSEQLQKLQKAWDMGYRGKGSNVIIPDELLVKDTELSIKNLMSNASKEDYDIYNNKKWDYETAKEKFGLSENPSAGDLEKFYGAWESGWRPIDAKGKSVSVPVRFQTDSYKKILEMSEAEEYFKNIPEDIVKDQNLGFGGKFWNVIKKYFYYRDVSTFQDIAQRSAYKTLGSAEVQERILNILKQGINRLTTSKTVDYSMLREEILKAGNDGKIKQKFQLEMVDKYREMIEKDLSIVIKDPAQLNSAKKYTNDFFAELKGTATDADLKQFGQKFGFLEDGNLSIIDFLMKKSEKGLSGYWDIFWKTYAKSDVGAKNNLRIIGVIIDRALNLWRSGSFFSRTELLAMRASTNFSPKSAGFNLIGRFLFNKVVLPLFYGLFGYMYNWGGILLEDWTDDDWGNFTQEPLPKQTLKKLLKALPFAPWFSEDKSEGNALYRFIVGLSNLTDSEFEEFWIYVADTFFNLKGREVDVIENEYKIRYIDPASRWNPFDTKPEWKEYPTGDDYGSYEEVDLEISKLRNKKVKYFCDISKPTKTKKIFTFNPGENVLCVELWNCDLETGKCKLNTDPNITTGYKTKKECTDKSDCNTKMLEYKKKLQDEKYRKEKEELEKKQEENKTTVTTSQDISFINKVVKNRTDGGKTWSRLEENGTFQPLVNAKKW